MQKFESLREMRMLPGFVEKVRRGAHQFKQIVGWYQFRETVPCSIADCRTPHNRGYVVAIQSGGRIGHTNIGHVCGRNEFGQAFEAAHIAAEKFLDRQRLRQTVIDTLDELPDLEKRARGLLDGPLGVQWLRQATGSLIRVCPGRVYEELIRRAARGETVISRSRRRTEHDPPGLDGSHSAYVTETVGVIAGLGCLAAPHPVDVLTNHLLKPIAEFSGLTADEILGTPATRRWFQEWRKRVPGEFEGVEKKLDLARAFFQTENLRRLALLTNRPEEQAQLEKVGWDDTAMLVTGPVWHRAATPGEVPVTGRRVVNLDKFSSAAERARVRRELQKGKKRKKRK